MALCRRATIFLEYSRRRREVKTALLEMMDGCEGQDVLLVIFIDGAVGGRGFGEV